eukprot:gnl/Dysnectes_brevis/5511_a7960_298.p1 GENE.gnl/Dysnectes_brevis/5511_a7960_298~~gnl/Dysnectes_brevis/5511_a7960_298.p1  ORF type:complete len:1232 (-),score=118.75 gnl/Dysnectes_brevis/5511_a7960_298:67-3762(-)
MPPKHLHVQDTSGDIRMLPIRSLSESNPPSFIIHPHYGHFTQALLSVYTTYRNHLSKAVSLEGTTQKSVFVVQSSIGEELLLVFRQLREHSITEACAFNLFKAVNKVGNDTLSVRKHLTEESQHLEQFYRYYDILQSCISLDKTKGLPGISSILLFPETDCTHPPVSFHRIVDSKTHYYYYVCDGVIIRQLDSVPDLADLFNYHPEPTSPSAAKLRETNAKEDILVYTTHLAKYDALKPFYGVMGLRIDTTIEKLLKVNREEKNSLSRRLPLFMEASKQLSPSRGGIPLADLHTHLMGTGRFIAPHLAVRLPVSDIHNPPSRYRSIRISYPEDEVQDFWYGACERASRVSDSPDHLRVYPWAVSLKEVARLVKQASNAQSRSNNRRLFRLAESKNQHHKVSLHVFIDSVYTEHKEQHIRKWSHVFVDLLHSDLSIDTVLGSFVNDLSQHLTIDLTKKKVLKNKTDADLSLSSLFHDIFFALSWLRCHALGQKEDTLNMLDVLHIVDPDTRQHPRLHTIPPAKASEVLERVKHIMTHYISKTTPEDEDYLLNVSTLFVCSEDLRKILLDEESLQELQNAKHIETTLEPVVNIDSLREIRYLGKDLHDCFKAVQPALLHWNAVDQLIVLTENGVKWSTFLQTLCRIANESSLSRMYGQKFTWNDPVFLRTLFEITPAETPVSFSTRFAPHCFVFRDVLVEHNLNVLIDLVKSTQLHYARANVQLVEFSASISDLVFRPWMLYHMTGFSKVCEGVPFKFGFLAALNRNKICLPLSLLERDDYGELDFKQVSVLAQPPEDKVNILTVLQSWLDVPQKSLDFEHIMRVLEIESERIFKRVFEQLDLANIVFEALGSYDEELHRLQSKPPFLHRYITGMDTVSDEAGFPFHVAWHKRFHDFVDRRQLERQQYTSLGKFGVRIHLGEVTEETYILKMALLSEAKASMAEPPVRLTEAHLQPHLMIGRKLYEFHLHHIVWTLKHLNNRFSDKRLLKCGGDRSRVCTFNLRIGVMQFHNTDRTGGIGDKLRAAVSKLLSDYRLVTELCLTSNASLLPIDNHPMEEFKSCHPDSSMVFCTDDDGILCVQGAFHSVKHEIMVAIDQNILCRINDPSTRVEDVMLAIRRCAREGFRSSFMLEEPDIFSHMARPEEALRVTAPTLSYAGTPTLSRKHAGTQGLRSYSTPQYSAHSNASFDTPSSPGKSLHLSPHHSSRILDKLFSPTTPAFKGYVSAVICSAVK